MRPSTRMTSLLLMCCLLSTVLSCSSKAPKAAFSDASVKCDPKARKDCWSVTPAYVKEHALLLDTVIRTKAALEFCRQSIEQNR